MSQPLHEKDTLLDRQAGVRNEDNEEKDPGVIQDKSELQKKFRRMEEAMRLRMKGLGDENVRIREKNRELEKALDDSTISSTRETYSFRER